MLGLCIFLLVLNMCTFGVALYLFNIIFNLHDAHQNIVNSFHTQKFENDVFLKVLAGHADEYTDNIIQIFPHGLKVSELDSLYLQESVQLIQSVSDKNRFKDIPRYFGHLFSLMILRLNAKALEIEQKTKNEEPVIDKRLLN